MIRRTNLQPVLSEKEREEMMADPCGVLSSYDYFNTLVEEERKKEDTRLEFEHYWNHELEKWNSRSKRRMTRKQKKEMNEKKAQRLDMWYKFCVEKALGTYHQSLNALSEACIKERMAIQEDQKKFVFAVESNHLQDEKESDKKVKFLIPSQEDGVDDRREEKDRIHSKSDDFGSDEKSETVTKTDHEERSESSCGENTCIDLVDGIFRLSSGEEEEEGNENLSSSICRRFTDPVTEKDIESGYGPDYERHDLSPISTTSEPASISFTTQTLLNQSDHQSDDLSIPVLEREISSCRI